MAAPVVTINDRTLRVNQWGQVGPWLSYSDADGNPATQLQFFDGGTAADSGYFSTSTNEHWAAGTTITVDVADLASVYVRGGSNVAGGSETLWVRAFDGTAWGNWDSFTLTTQANAAPVAAISDHTLQVNQWASVASWLSYSDGDGDPAVQLQFFDGGTAADSGFFDTSTNHHWAAGTTITVNVADLGSVYVFGGSNPTGFSETMWVRAFDGISWGNWDSFTLTTPANVAPVATINDHTLARNEWAQASTWLSYADANGNPAVRYQFWDSGTAADSGYFYSSSNEHHAANTVIDVAAADLANVYVRGGSNPAGGAETMWVRAFDGIAWGNWDAFTLNTAANANPVATINDLTLAANEWASLGSRISYSDGNGDPVVQLQFWDSGTGADSGYFYTNHNEHHAANTSITVMASEISNVFVRGGSAAGAETMWVRAFDGTSWGNWDSFTLTTA